MAAGGLGFHMDPSSFHLVRVQKVRCVCVCVCLWFLQTFYFNEFYLQSGRFVLYISVRAGLTVQGADM